MAGAGRGHGSGTGSGESDGDFHRPRRKSALEFCRSLCCRAAKGTFDLADRSAYSAGNPAPLFSYGFHAQRSLLILNAVDLKDWKLQVEGNVNKPLALGLAELTQKFKPVSVAAVSQCSGNSRSRLQPRVPGGQWGNDVDGSPAARASRYGWGKR